MKFNLAPRSSQLSTLNGQNFCIYSGKYLPKDALNDEHVIPRALGGNRSVVIRADRTLNSTFATTIDARIANDGMVIFGRRDTHARGHSGKTPVPVINNARIWRKGDAWNAGDPKYRIEVHNGETKIFDIRKRTYLPQSIFSDAGFIATEWNIDSVARFRFCVKTLLGLGWKFFQYDFVQAVDCDPLREVLQKDIRFTPPPKDGIAASSGAGYSDEFLAQDEDEKAFVASIQQH